jgi:hypothetical protein
MSSSHQTEHSGDSTQFTITAFGAFVVVFVFVVLMSLWHGSYKPAIPGTDTTMSVENK